MNTNTEVIEIKVENSFINKLMIIAEAEEEALSAAKKWCKEHDCSLDYITSKHEHSSNVKDGRTIFYAGVCSGN